MKPSLLAAVRRRAGGVGGRQPPAQARRPRRRWSARLDPAQDQAVRVDGQHLGHLHSAARPRPARAGPSASAAKNPAGAWVRVFISAVVPLERRSLVAAGDVAAGDRRGGDHGAAEELLGTAGQQRLPGQRTSEAVRQLADQRRGAATLDHGQHLLEPVVATVVRVGHLAAGPDGSKSRRAAPVALGGPSADVGEVGRRPWPARRSRRRARRRRAGGPGAAAGRSPAACSVAAARWSIGSPTCQPPVPQLATLDQAAQARPGRPRREHDVGHRGAADVAQADQARRRTCRGCAAGAARSRGEPVAGADRESTTQVTTVTTIAPPTAGQKPVTRKPMPSCSAASRSAGASRR